MLFSNSLVRVSGGIEYQNMHYFSRLRFFFSPLETIRATPLRYSIVFGGIMQIFISSDLDK